MKACEPKRDHSFVENGPVRRIALISPWGGGNLGNATLISAVIDNLTKRLPGVEFVGITLSPGYTRGRFGIDTFPLAAVSRPFYGVWDPDPRGNAEGQIPKRRRVRQWIKRIPLVGRCLRALNIVRKELAHIAAAARVVRRLDRVIVPGGGALDELWGGPWGHPWSLFKWSVLSRVYRVPFLFLSIGKCSLEHPTSRFFVRVSLRLASYRSYRDPDSQRAVQYLVDASNDPVQPDLAFSYSGPGLEASSNRDSRKGRLVVGVSPIAYCDPRTWPHKDEPAYAAYLGHMAEFIKWLLKEGHQVLLFATDTPDIPTLNDVQAAVADPSIDPNAIQTLPSPFGQSVEGHLKAIGSADFVVASRLHGVILSHLNAIPVLALSFDPKVDAYMRSVGQQDYCLSIDPLQLDTLIERFQALQTGRPQETTRLRSAARSFRQMLDRQYDMILKAADSSGRWRQTDG